jgi:hypothetical protein
VTPFQVAGRMLPSLFAFLDSVGGPILACPAG